MRIRQGFECDHSSRDYGYISGMSVYYDYGTFQITFVVPYSMDLFKLLKKHKHLEATKSFNKISICVYLYCEDFNEEPGEYVDLATEIRDGIVKKDVEAVKVLDMYHGENEKYSSLKVHSKLAKKLQEILTEAW